MEKEYWLLIAISFFILSEVFESFAGSVQLNSITNPLAFLSKDYLVTYPLTAAAIGVRALALVISALLLTSLTEKHYFAKAIFLLAVGAVAELYAIQQLATGAKLTPVQLTLSFAYAGAGLVPAIFGYLLRGAFGGISARLAGEPKSKEEKDESQKRIERIKGLNP